MDIGTYCFHLSLQTGVCGRSKKLRTSKARGKLCVLTTNVAVVSRLSWSKNNTKRIHRRVCTIPSRNHQIRCYCFLNAGPSLDIESVNKATLTLARALNNWKGSPVIIRVASAVGVVIFAIWGLGPLVRKCRNTFLRLKNPTSDSSWKRSSTYHVTTSYVQPLLLWIGAMLICRALDPMVLASEAGHVVKARVLNFVRSLSTVLAFAHCLSSVIQQTQRFFVETNDLTDARNMGFHFASRAVNAAVWVAAVSLFMELLGFSTQKWVTAGGLGTVLLTLAGREILTNFLSSAMIHATRPFVLNEWIQTKIEGYEVSGTVEHIGWWSPTIIRGDDREAVHIPNHKFTMNIVRNLSQKTHWRIKTHLAISHLDVGKINNIVADMRKVLAKNPQVEQQKLHRRVFLDYINPENQALTILVSCFVKTSHFEEYLCVKESILLDLLRVITHHQARLATPIRTVQKIYTKADLDDAPFPDSVFTHGAASNDRFLLIEPSYKISADDRTKTQARPPSVNGYEDSSDKATTLKSSTQSTSDSKDDANSEETEFSTVNTKEMTATSDAKTNDSPMSKQSPRQEATLPSSVPQQDLSQLTVTKSSLEENLVLGVALDGSKRTLPIEEEDIASPSNLEDTKDLAALHSSSNVAAVADDKSDSRRARGPDSPAADQLDQQA